MRIPSEIRPPLQPYFFSLKIMNFWMATVALSSLNYITISNLWWKRVTMHSVQNANSALGPLIQVFSPMVHIITMDFFCQNCLIIIDELLTNNSLVLKMWKNPIEHPTFTFLFKTKTFKFACILVLNGQAWLRAGGVS